MSPAGGSPRAVRTCGATTGFFVLERCDRNARTGCSRCTRSLCERHVMQLPGDPGPACPECYAAARGYIADPSDDLWTIGFRRSFYWDVSSTTGDPTFWSGFDDFDRDAFEQQGDQGDWADGGFDDSADYLDS